MTKVRSANEIAIVIPVYRELKDFEKISLQQCLRVLGEYPMVLLAPESMDVTHYLALWPFAVERFDDASFQGTSSYSKLLLSQRFYQRFQSYTYILIHQLDVFVFSDRLKNFCSKGYDYIGAPVPRWGWQEVRNRVGNGGCSLRKVSSCLRVLSELPPDRFFSSLRRGDRPEDVYFAGCAGYPYLHFRAPTLKEALDFAVDYEIFRCYRKLPQWLPFACHAWQKKLEVWKSIIESFGYQVPTCNPSQKDFAHQDVLREYVFERISRKRGVEIWEKIVSTRLRSFFPLAVWGFGKEGHRWIELFQKLRFPEPLVFDRRAESDELSVLYPTQKNVTSCGMFILITSYKFASEITRELCSYGLQEGKDFMDARHFLDEIGAWYYEAVFGSCKL